MQLDLSKASDKVNWNYLEATLNAFGFDKQWTKWILALIKSTNFPYWSMAPPLHLSPPPKASGKETLSPHSFL